MKVLVTGGAGFVGSHTVDALLRDGHEVVVLDSIEKQVHGKEHTSPSLLAPYIKKGDIQFFQERVENRAILVSLLKDCDAVIHLAAALGVGQSAHEPQEYAASNALGTATLMDVLLKEKTNVRKLVVASSISVYGEGCGWNPHRKMKVSPVRSPDDLQKMQWEPKDPADGTIIESCATPENYPLKPTSVYGLTKHFTEQVVLLSARKEDLSVMCLRYTNIYGPGQSLCNPYTGPLAIFYARLKNKKPPIVFEDGKQTRDFIHVNDVASANVLSLNADVGGSHVVNIATGVPTSLLDIVRLLQKELNTDIEPDILHQARQGDIRYLFLDTTLAQKILNFTATRSIEEGIKDVINREDTLRIEDKTEQAMIELVRYGLVTNKKTL